MSKNEIDQELYEALDTLCDQLIPNRGLEHAFTMGCHDKDLPWYLVRAEQAIKRAENFVLVETWFS